MSEERYALREVPDSIWPPGVLDRSDRLIREALAGTLTEAAFYELTDLVRHPTIGMVMPRAMFERRFDSAEILSPHLMRMRFIGSVGFAVFTSEYRDSLARLLAGRRVVEVCARTGVLGPLMAARGLDWHCTDREPRAPHVERLDAVASIDRHRPDVVFASWCDHGSDVDQRIAERVPCVIIGEGCTGTFDDGFHENPGYEVEPVQSLGWFQDVPNWEGLSDRTVLTVPKGVDSPFSQE